MFGNLAYDPAFYTYTNPVSVTRARIAAARFAQKNFSILLDTHILREHARAEVSPFRARLPLGSPWAVSLKAKLRIERQEGVRPRLLFLRSRGT